MADTKDMILDATMELVAEKGLEGFKIGQISKKLGIAQGTIYFHYESKEEVLYESFLKVNREIAKLYEDCKIPEIKTAKDLEEFLHTEWLRYYSFMIQNGNKSLFYYAYRESKNLDRVLMKNNAAMATAMAGFTKAIVGALAQIGAFQKLPPNYLWAHIIDGTGVFVKHALHNNNGDEGVDPEIVWKLLFGGMKEFM